MLFHNSNITDVWKKEFIKKRIIKFFTLEWVVTPHSAAACLLTPKLLGSGLKPEEKSKGG